MDTTPVRMEELLAHASWVRRLAARLVRDPTTADDVAQEVWASALRAPPRERTNLRGWLSAAVRSAAFSIQRGESRRRARERASFTSREEIGAADFVERAQWHRELVEHVLALDEPQRSLVLARWFEELSVAEAARRLGLTSRVAQLRLDQALECLRHRLDREHGDRKAWSVAFLRWTGPHALELTAAGSGGMLALGGLAMSTKLIVAGVALIAVASVAWFLWPRAEPVRTLAANTLAGGPSAHVAPVAADSTRTPIEKAQASDSSESAGPDAPPPTELRGRVIDTSNRAIPGARVELRHGEMRDFSVPDHALSYATRALAEMTTDASGEFRFEIERGIPVDLHAEAANLCPALIPDCRAGEFVIVELSAGYRVSGRVTRARDGAPVADADVRLFQRGGPESLRRETRTTADGGYELRFGFHDRPMLDIVPQLEQSPGWVEFTLDANGEAEQNVTVKDGFVVLGKVSDAGSGQPISGAIVAEDFVLRHSAVTDAQGEYRLAGFGDSRGAELFAKATGYGTARRQDLPGAGDGVLHVDFKLKPGRRAHGLVVDASGTPLRDVLSVAIAREYDAQGERLDWIASRTDATGRFSVESLSSDLRHSLLLSKYGSATCVYDFPKVELSTGDFDLGIFALGPPALLAGVVEDESGKRLADVEVKLTGNNGDRSRLLDGPVASDQRVVDVYTSWRTTRTDIQGRFSFGGLSAGTYSLLARRSGRPDGTAVELVVGEAELKEDVKLRMPSGARLFGRVVDPEGRAVEGASVSAKPLKPAESGSKPNRDARARSDAEGRFEILGLSPGEYRVIARPWAKAGSDADEPLMPASVERASTDSSELKIALSRGATIRGSLHDKSGGAMFGYLVVVPSKVDESPIITTDANGEFCVAVVRDSVNEIEIHGPLEGGLMDRVFLVEHDVPAGTRGLRLTLP